MTMTNAFGIGLCGCCCCLLFFMNMMIAALLLVLLAVMIYYFRKLVKATAEKPADHNEIIHDL